MATPRKPQKDPMERLGELIDEHLTAREQRAAEEKDPAARARRIFDRLEKFLDSVETPEEPEEKPEKPEKEEGGSILKVLGLE